MATKLVDALKSEISRLARKEAKAAVAPLQDAIKKLRDSNRELKRANRDLEAKTARLAKAVCVPVAKKPAPDLKRRVSSGPIKRLRQRLDLSQDDFGKVLGVSSATVWNWESGKTRPNQDGMDKIVAARALSPAKARKMVG